MRCPQSSLRGARARHASSDRCSLSAWVLYLLLDRLLGSSRRGSVVEALLERRRGDERGEADVEAKEERESDHESGRRTEHGGMPMRATKVDGWPSRAGRRAEHSSTQLTTFWTAFLSQTHVNAQVEDR